MTKQKNNIYILCDPENDSGTHQTRDHLFKFCYRWKDQQAVLWARVKEATKRAKRKWRVGDLLADERCSPAVLDFLPSTHVGRAAPPVEGKWHSGDEEEEAVEAGGWDGGACRVVTRGPLASVSFVLPFVRLRYIPWSSP